MLVARSNEVTKSAEIYKDTYNSMILDHYTRNKTIWRTHRVTTETSRTVIETSMRSQFSSGMEWGWEAISNDREPDSGSGGGDKPPNEESKDAAEWSLWVERFQNEFGDPSMFSLNASMLYQMPAAPTHCKFIL